MQFWYPVDDAVRQRQFLKGLYFLLVGLVVGVLFTYGVANASGFSSVTVECMPNGTYNVLRDGETTGIIFILVSGFVLVLSPLAFCVVRREYRQHVNNES